MTRKIPAPEGWTRIQYLDLSAIRIENYPRSFHRSVKNAAGEWVSMKIHFDTDRARPWVLSCRIDGTSTDGRFGSWEVAKSSYKTIGRAAKAADNLADRIYREDG